jgi:hypothetical protein
MKMTIDTGFAIVVGVVIGFTLGVFGGDNTAFEEGAIERGYALYCPLTGELAFVGECDDNSQ